MEIIKKRFKTHMEQSQPIEAKSKQMELFIKVQGKGSIEEIFNKIVVELYYLFFKRKKIMNKIDNIYLS